MKAIRVLCHPPIGLMRYLKRQGVKTWKKFHRNVADRKELVCALEKMQRGLCAYCEIDLQDGDRQIEHVVPRSDPIIGSALALDVTNMIACCLGGTSGSTVIRSNDERYRLAVSDNISCGQAKADTAQTIDPRKIPPLPALMRVLPDGRIVADRTACVKANMNCQFVDQSIKTLGLNVERLRVAREHLWNALNDVWGEDCMNDEVEVITNAVRMELLPQKNGELRKYFTTIRSYFSPLAEEILREDPKVWV